MRGLVICAGLSLGIAIALGFGRFAYALVLPAMREDLGLSFAEAGALNSANALGHLAGALVAIGLVNRMGPVRATVWSAALTALAIAATPLLHRFDYLMVMRFLPGLTGGVTFVAAGALAARASGLLGPSAALGVGVYHAGPGIGIMLSALLVVPFVAADAAGWPLAWYAMGAVSLIMAAGVFFSARQVPEPGPDRADADGAGDVPLWPALLGYGLFAAGYVGYVTFIIANVQERGAALATAGYWWAGLGFAVISGGWLWSGVIRAADGRALSLLTGLTGLATVVPLAPAGTPGFIVSFLLFGVSFLAVVAATTNLIRLARPAQDWPRWIAYFTLAFGLGQSIGPTATGFAADVFGTTDAVLWVSAALLFLGAATALMQRRVN